MVPETGFHAKFMNTVNRRFLFDCELSGARCWQKSRTGSDELGSQLTLGAHLEGLPSREGADMACRELSQFKDVAKRHTKAAASSSRCKRTEALK